MADRFRSLFTREREFEARVHSELTEVARERIANITSHRQKYHKSAFRELADEVGTSRIYDVSEKLDHTEFIHNADTILALSYVEHLFRILWNEAENIHNRNVPKGDVRNRLAKLEDVIVTEGLLWEIKDSTKYVQFRPIESEAMEDVDKKVQALAEEDPWKNALKGYNDAFELYLEGTFDDTLVTKLYNSIEEVLKTICVDLEKWTDDREMSHGNYLDLLRQHGFYHANGITAPEINELMDSMEKMVSKVGNGRKQRHAYHDRAYMTLLIHQVGAFLYFLISRYDDYSS